MARRALAGARVFAGEGFLDDRAVLLDGGRIAPRPAADLVRLGDGSDVRRTWIGGA